jgi:hypothetical protein
MKLRGARRRSPAGADSVKGSMRPVRASSAADGASRPEEASERSLRALSAGVNDFIALRHARSRNRPCVARRVTSLLAGQLKLARLPIALRARKAPRAGSSALIGVRGAVAARRSRPRCPDRVWFGNRSFSLLGSRWSVAQSRSATAWGLAWTDASNAATRRARSSAVAWQR